MKVATMHGDNLGGVLKSIDADEVWIVAAINVTDSAILTACGH